MMDRVIILLVLLIMESNVSFAQSREENNLIDKLIHHQQNTLQEKVFIHLDRTFYVGGETMWMKIYVMDGYRHHPLDMSKVVYVDVIDRNKQPVIQTKLSIENGRGSGSVIIPASLESDNYTVRAYTNWMKNFSSDFYFEQPISIVNVFQRLTRINKKAASQLDVQFFPEGGNLVEGISSKVAFRVVNPLGEGIDFKGVILNKKGDTITTFSPLKFGIGNFTITPTSEENYQASITETNGKITIANLPTIQSQGYTIMVTDTIENQIIVHVKTKDTGDSETKVYLIAHTRQLVKVASAQKLNHGSTTFLLSKKEIGEGIVHLTLFDQNQKPVCERLYFNRPEHTVSLSFQVDKNTYHTRSKINLTTRIKKDTSFIAHASLSIFKSDSLQQIKPIDIQSYLWLTSDLKGRIESPEYYFSDDSNVNAAMDNLMLTHGWSRFIWKEVLQPSNKTFLFLPEYNGHLLNAKVTDINTSKSIVRVPVYLSTPGKRIQPYITYTNDSGQATFETGNLIGNKKLIVQAKNNQNYSRIEIESPFSQSTSSTIIPHLELSENLKNSLTLRSISMQTEDMFYRGRIKIKDHPTDSSTFYGFAPEHYNLNEYTRFPVMEEVIREYVKGVRLRKKEDQFLFKVLNAPENYLFEKEPLILIDGVPTFNMSKIMAMDPLKIKSLDVVTNPYYYGQFAFHGIVSFKTYNHDLAGFELDPDAIVLNYEGLQSEKEFFAPRYENNSDRLNRMPDLRNLLLWIPDVTINSHSKEIDLYSSDETGIYQAIIQGLSQNGEPVFETCFFEVKSEK